VTSAEVVGALDIGGTHVSAGRVRLAHRSIEPASRIRLSLRADGGRSELLSAISRAASSIARPDVSRLGVAVPGPFDYCTGVSKIAHKLQGLYGIDLRSQLGGASGVTDPAAVRFLNDADAFLLGEWWAGAARGHTRAVGITLGTGLGSSFIEDGRIVRTGPGVPPKGVLYKLSFRGAPVEEAISSKALLARYGAPPEEPTSVAEIAVRAKAAERSACRVFEELGQAMAEFLTPWLRAFAPGCLVVGGSIARSWELFEATLRVELEKVEGLETVTVAQHLDDAPLLGAARYVASGLP
jgi:glucokinase